MNIFSASSLAIGALLAAVTFTSADAAQKRHRAPAPVVQTEPRFVDNVGSLAYDGRGYAYNRFSGQRYYSCVIDEGYGRVTYCDASGRGR